MKVKLYLQAVLGRGGVLTTAVTMASATAIVCCEDRNLLLENGGSVDITANWAKSVLYRKGFVKRRGTTTMKIAVDNFDSVKEQFLFDIIIELPLNFVRFLPSWCSTGI